MVHLSFHRLRFVFGYLKVVLQESRCAWAYQGLEIYTTLPHRANWAFWSDSLCRFESFLEMNLFLSRLLILDLCLPSRWLFHRCFGSYSKQVWLVQVLIASLLPRYSSECCCLTNRGESIWDSQLILAVSWSFSSWTSIPSSVIGGRVDPHSVTWILNHHGFLGETIVFAKHPFWNLGSWSSGPVWLRYWSL